MAGDGAPSLEELARRLLDLWQDQLGAAAANPDLATQAARLMAAMPLPGMWLGQMGQMGLNSGQAPPGSGLGGAEIAKNWAELARNWMDAVNQKGSGHAGRTPDQAGATPPRPETPAAASQSRSLDMDELRTRLAGLEERLAELGSSKPKRKPTTKSASPKRGGARPPRKRDAKAGAGDPGGGSPPTDDGAAG